MLLSGYLVASQTCMVIALVASVISAVLYCVWLSKPPYQLGEKAVTDIAMATLGVELLVGQYFIIPRDTRWSRGYVLLAVSC